MTGVRLGAASRAAAALAALALTLLCAGPARAVTLSFDPSPATAGGQVTVTAGVQWTVSSPVPAGFSVGFLFGDGATRVVPISAASCNASKFCRLSARHAYAAAGSYTVIAEVVPATFGAPLIVPPNPVTRTLVVNPPVGPPPPPPPPPPPAVAPKLTVAPAAHAIPFGQESLRRVTWAVSGDPALGAALVSPAGRFVAGGETVGTEAAQLSLGVAGGAGAAAETVRVPVAVIEAVLARGLNRFSWVREFHAPDLDLAGGVEFTVAGRGAADFRVTRIDLRFENREAQITVPRGREGLRAFAQIAFTGTGLLVGRWEVDGRPIADVSRHLAGGGTATLETPAVPPLPTFDPGSHTVRFVPLSPAAPGTLPSMIFFVTPDEAPAAPVAIGLLEPESGARPELAPLRFGWSADGAGSVFLVEFFEDPAGKPVFSAWTPEAHYALPELISRGLFSSGKRYFWKVTGYDPEGNLVGESTSRPFFF